MTDSPDPILVRAEEAARLVSLSLPTFREWVESGHMPRPAVSRGRTKLWRVADLEALGEKKRKPSKESFAEACRARAHLI